MDQGNRIVRMLSTVSERSARVVVACAAICTAGSQALGEEPGDGTLPISSITLYRSGVGYFERLGQVEGNAAIQLRFATEQVNDILKSMVVLDLGGGTIESVRYGSQEPLERRLASFAIDVSEAPTMDDLLEQLRGAPVKVWTTEGVVEGTVMGVEWRTEMVDKATVQKPFVNLLTSDGLKSVGLHTATNMQIADPALAAELAKALGALAEHRADNTKAVDLSLRGEGEREIFVSYIHEMPVWKASYRLVLPKEGTERAAEDRPTLQGWAIVENNTDEDWQGVDLALVAGQPVSFTMDLYQPLYVRRPEVPVPVAAGVGPRNYEGGVPTGGAGGQSPFQDSDEELSMAVDRAASARLREAAPAAPGLSSKTGRGGRDSTSFGVDAVDEYGAPAQATGESSGEVFMYRLDTPVTIERRQSAMLPILSSPIDGERISIYSANEGGKHPMMGARIVNSTGLQLMPGPIAVFDGASYAGDATVAHVPNGDSRMLAYAVDLEVDSSVSTGGTVQTRKVRIVDGLIVQTFERETAATYTFTNKDLDRARSIVVETPKLDGWTLVTPAKPDETTDSAYRFSVAVEKGKSGSVTISQRRIESHQIEIASMDLNTLVGLQRDGAASQQVIDAFKEAARLNELVTETERRMNATRQEIEAISTDQSRIRQNMAGVDKTSQLYARYMQKLDEQETSLETLRKDLAVMEKEREERREAYAAYIRTLNVE